MSSHISDIYTVATGKTIKLLDIICPCGEEGRSITFDTDDDSGEVFAHVNHGKDSCPLPVDTFCEMFHEIVLPTRRRS